MLNEYIIYENNKDNKYFRAEKKIATYFNGEIFGSPLVAIAEILENHRLNNILDNLLLFKSVEYEPFEIHIHDNNAIIGSSYVLKQGNYEREDLKIQVPLHSLISIIKTWILLQKVKAPQIFLRRINNSISINGEGLNVTTLFERYVYPWENEESPCEYILYTRSPEGNYKIIATNLDLNDNPCNQPLLTYLSEILTSDMNFIETLCSKLFDFKDHTIIMDYLYIHLDNNMARLQNVRLSEHSDEEILKPTVFYRYALKEFLKQWIIMTQHQLAQITLSRKGSSVKLAAGDISCSQILQMGKL